MITTVFAFGAYDKSKGFVPLIGKTNDEMYFYAVLLLLLVAAGVPIMLLTKPLMSLNKSKHQRVDDKGRIELVNIEKQKHCSHNKVDSYQEL